MENNVIVGSKRPAGTINRVIDQTDKEAEYYRNMVVAQGDEIEILRANVKELQGQLQGAYRRIAELREALDTETKERRDIFDGGISG